MYLWEHSVISTGRAKVLHWWTPRGSGSALMKWMQQAWDACHHSNSNMYRPIRLQSRWHPRLWIPTHVLPLQWTGCAWWHPLTSTSHGCLSIGALLSFKDLFLHLWDGEEGMGDRGKDMQQMTNGRIQTQFSPEPIWYALYPSSRRGAPLCCSWQVPRPAHGVSQAWWCSELGHPNMPLFSGSSTALVMIHFGDAWSVTRTNSLHKRRYLSVPLAHSGIHYLRWHSDIVEKNNPWFVYVTAPGSPPQMQQCEAYRSDQSLGSPKLGLRKRKNCIPPLSTIPSPDGRAK